jgi:lipopolysaccharide export LptBFGC system permease protein LptF
MKWTVQRYVLREVVQTWLAVTGVLVAILVSNQLSRVLGQAADNQYGRCRSSCRSGCCWPWC